MSRYESQLSKRICSDTQMAGSSLPKTLSFAAVILNSMSKSSVTLRRRWAIHLQSSRLTRWKEGLTKHSCLEEQTGKSILQIYRVLMPGLLILRLRPKSRFFGLVCLRSHTTVPVPQVLAWNSDPSNPVGAEYIMMERAPGIQLFQKWDDLDGDNRLSLIKQLTEPEHQLASIPFPASGHLYFMESILEKKHILLDSSVDSTSQYGIGPLCHRSWDIDQSRLNPNLSRNLDPGPWKSVAAYGRALVEREIFRLRTQLSTRPDRLHYANIEDDIALLQKTADLIDRLESYLSLEQNSQPTLWHIDLHMGNIFVSETEPSKIVSLIDWQSISVSPLFLQVRWPVFLEPPDDYVKGFPRTDSNKLREPKRTRPAHTLKTRDAYNAINVPRAFRELFIRCGEVFEEGVEPLRACLIEVSQSWEALKLPGTCPFSFTPNEISAHDISFGEYEELHRVRKFALEYLDTDSEGWIAPSMDFDEKRAQNKALFEYYLDNSAVGKSREELLRIRPFSESSD
ncbi:Altered inheritance of mitochondria protein, mitochondrial [Lachnellula subtilissima]|uniref:Altered inheritance of mitochondria protein 9, mitochondrial n=1 Tax=Lachnellula subtilissima TaxID=602034 RepID=A0A8H8U384_9HELO|nr:Altered inheritance of mitochondria protein, mitochondrial [Lachnellula subtilissima]